MVSLSGGLLEQEMAADSQASINAAQIVQSIFGNFIVSFKMNFTFITK